MSNYTSTPIPPRPATQEEVINQIEQLRRQLEEQLRNAQDAATRQALERALEIQRQQAQKYQDSINRLDQETRERLDDMDRSHRKLLTDITRQVYDDINKTQKELEHRFNRQLDDLASDVSDQLKGLDTKIQRQQRDIKAINEQMEIIVNDINDLAHDIDERFNENELKIADIQKDLAGIHQRFQDEDEKARQEVKIALDLLRLVEQRTMLDRFIPNEAQNVRLTVQWLTENQNQGAALTAAADQAINDIRLAEIHATQEKAKHDAMVEIALTQIEKVLTVVNKNRELEQEVEGGDPMKVECDFWSEGEYGRLEKELNDLKAELEDRYNVKLTKQRIADILRRSAEIEGRILQISAESVAKAILSEARVETVEDIVNAMVGKGWVLKGDKKHPEFDYMGGEVDHDWRKGVCAVLENNVGEEITVIVDPISESQNRLIVHQETSKSGKTDKEVQEKMQTIKKELCDLGYEVGAPMAGKTHIPEMGSTERLGKAHATDKVRQKIEKQ